MNILSKKYVWKEAIDSALITWETMEKISLFIAIIQKYLICWGEHIIGCMPVKIRIY